MAKTAKKADFRARVRRKQDIQRNRLIAIVKEELEWKNRLLDLKTMTRINLLNTDNNGRIRLRLQSHRLTVKLMDG